MKDDSRTDYVSQKTVILVVRVNNVLYINFMEEIKL